MGKFFCPECNVLSYSLRFIFNEKWEKPKGNLRYCKRCQKTFIERECIILGVKN